MRSAGEQPVNREQSVEEKTSLQLEEYKEALTYLRHDDQQAWTILGLSGTVALALWAYTFKDAPFWSTKALVLALLGVLAVVVGRLMARRITSHTCSRRARAVELEEALGFELLTGMERRRPRMFAPGVNVMLDIVTWSAVGGWLAYLGALLLRGT